MAEERKRNLESLEERKKQLKKEFIDALSKLLVGKKICLPGMKEPIEVVTVMLGWFEGDETVIRVRDDSGIYNIRTDSAVYVLE